jgi:hypothetical protein
MDIEKELQALAVEQRAYAIVLEFVLGSLAVDRTMRYKITEAFNQAEHRADDVAVEIGNRYPVMDVMKLRATIKDIRKSVLGAEAPKGFP